MNKVILPELGDGIRKATVACWHFKIGELIQQEDDVVEVVTDKATFTISASSSGKLKEIFIEEGKEAEIGQVLAIIE